MKLYFDANVGEPLVESLRGVFRFHPEPKPRLIHIYDIFDRDIKDHVWIPQCRGKNNIIVSGDWGRSRGAKLPAVCKANNITHILISPTLHKAKQFHKARAIIYVWPKILEAFDASAGACFQVTSRGVNYERFHFEKRN